MKTAHIWTKNHKITAGTFIINTVPLFSPLFPLRPPTKWPLMAVLLFRPPKWLLSVGKYQKIPAELPDGEVSQATEL